MRRREPATSFSLGRKVCPEVPNVPQVYPSTKLRIPQKPFGKTSLFAASGSYCRLRADCVTQYAGRRFRIEVEPGTKVRERIMSKPLPSYLRTHRKRSGLTQDEVAFLLGVRSGSKVSRYERLTRKPTLENLFALQVVYRTVPHMLFLGIFEEIEKTVIKRASVLAIEVRSLHTGPQAKRKLAALETIALRDSTMRHKDL